jgi:beta-lactamase regulating signal transducer with metallopeptidase domain
MILTPILNVSASFSAHVLEPAARSVAFACVAGLVLAAFRVRSIALRLAIWRTVLLVALAMPFLGQLLPPLPVFVPLAEKFVREQTPTQITPATESNFSAIGVNQVAHSNSTKVGTFRHSFKSSNAASAPAASAAIGGSPAKVQPRGPFPWFAASSAIYFAIAIFMLIRLALGVILGRRLEREALPIADSQARARLLFFANSAGVRAPPRLAESDLLSVPVTFGVRRPAILLPAGWRDWEPAELDAVLAHEISHVLRRDALAERLALIHRAIFWFSPLSWWLARHLADLAEEASDDAALAAGADRTRYAETLLGFFAALEAAPGRVWWQGVSMATAGQAEKRVDRILEWKGSVAMRLKKPVVIAYILLAVPVICLVAAFRPTIITIHPTPEQQAAPQATQPTAVPGAQPAPAAVAAPAAPSMPAAPSVAPLAAPVALQDPAPASPESPEASVHVRVRPVISVEPVVSVHTVVTPLVIPNVKTVVVPDVKPVVSVAPIVTVRPMRPFELQSTNGAYQTVIAGDDDDQQFTIVSGNSTVSVSSDNFSISTEGNSNVANSLRHSFPGDFIWFVRDGKSYIIRDPATIKQAMDFFAPARELGRQQDELGKQQEALGAQQEALGAKQEALAGQMEKVRVKIPDMTAELEKLQADLKKLGADGTPEDLGRIQEKIGEIQERIGELQAKAGEKQSELGEKQGALGEEQGKLGEQQGKLGEQQGRLGEQQEEASRKAAREMKKLLDQALASGLAKPA